MKNDKQSVLIICNTYMQLISAIQIKRFFLKEKNVDLLLSDHSIRSGIVVENLALQNIFYRVKSVYSKEKIYEQNNWEDIKDIFALIFGFRKRFFNLLWEEQVAYDEIYYYNRDILCLIAYDQSLRNGKNPRPFCFEEGIFSYQEMCLPYNVGRRIRIIQEINKILHRKNFFEETNSFLCYYPELFPKINNANCNRIPLLRREDDEMVKILNSVFEYRPEKYTYHQKYFFFASSADVDGNSVGETELVLKIADLVGKENLLVKMHPRDNRSVYKDYGLSVLSNSFVPWEVIQLNHNFENHVFLTLSSSSVLNATAILNDNIETYFLYPLIKGKNKKLDSFCENYIAKTVRILKELGTLKEVHIINSLGIFEEKSA